MSMIAIQQTVNHSATPPGCSTSAAPGLGSATGQDGLVIFFPAKHGDFVGFDGDFNGDLTNRNVDFMVILMGIYGL